MLPLLSLSLSFNFNQDNFCSITNTEVTREDLSLNTNFWHMKLFFFLMKKQSTYNDVPPSKLLELVLPVDSS